MFTGGKNSQDKEFFRNHKNFTSIIDHAQPVFAYNFLHFRQVSTTFILRLMMVSEQPTSVFLVKLHVT